MDRKRILVGWSQRIAAQSWMQVKQLDAHTVAGSLGHTAASLSFWAVLTRCLDAASESLSKSSRSHCLGVLDQYLFLS